MTEFEIKRLLYLDEQIDLLEDLQRSRILNQSYLKADYVEALDIAVTAIKAQIRKIEGVDND